MQHTENQDKFVIVFTVQANKPAGDRKRYFKTQKQTQADRNQDAYRKISRWGRRLVGLPGIRRGGQVGNGESVWSKMLESLALKENNWQRVREPETQEHR